MKKIITGITLGAILLCATISVGANLKSHASNSDEHSPLKNSSGWTLTWSDEFDAPSLNTNNWTFDIGTGSSGWGNNELQYYTSDSKNICIEDGNLKITALKENYQGSSYTSARIKSEGLKTFKYGRIEARIKAPAGQGLWPAFWMLGSDFSTVNWPYCGEIDIFEHVNTEDKVYGTVHWDSNGYATYSNNLSGIDVTQYHTYAIEWDEDYIIWYCDDAEVNKILIKDNTGDTEEFHKDYFLLLNLAVGGNWPQSPDNSTTFPASMYVDYVRVYQKNGASGDNIITDNNSDTNSSDNSDDNIFDNNDSENSHLDNVSVSQVDSNTVTLSLKNTIWADIHYQINNRPQLNYRMQQNDSDSSYTITNLQPGDTISYWFTYWDNRGYATDTQNTTYTLK